MRKLQASAEVLRYLDHEIAAPPVSRPVAPAPVKASRRWWIWMLIALAVVVILLGARFACAQPLCVADVNVQWCSLDVEALACHGPGGAEPLPVESPGIASLPSVDGTTERASNESPPAVEERRCPPASAWSTGTIDPAIVGLALFTFVLTIILAARARAEPTLAIRSHRVGAEVSVPELEAFDEARQGDAAVGSRVGGRAHQEDASRLVTRPGLSALIVADGMGGHPGGARASALAVDAVAATLESDLAERIQPSSSIAELLRTAFSRAAERLYAEAVETGTERFGIDAFRTTLLVLVATDTHFVSAGIGDGEILLRTGAGKWQPLFAAGEKVAQHVVATSLGPVVIGEPVVAEHPRMRGAVGLVATDGISDRVTRAFYEGLALGAREGRTAAELVGEALAVVETNPDVFDDNATLGIILPDAPE